jgi:surface polysaccharide O-acyltransferase-like enzyme
MGVIITHVAAGPVHRYNFSTDPQWWVGNIYDSFIHYCVPVFVMITGALLLPQTITLKSFLQKRVKRIFIPFLFWSVVYIYFTLDDYSNDLTLFFVLKTVTAKLLYGASDHLWYIYMIIGLYLFVPIHLVNG